MGQNEHGFFFPIQLTGSPVLLYLNFWQGLTMHLNKTKINLLKIESILRLGQQPFAILLPLISTFHAIIICVILKLKFLKAIIVLRKPDFGVNL